jgi:acetyl-coenzyme A synthetase (EC 6.2.1.1)
MMAQGDEFVERCSRRSLRVLGSVGEPINPEAWEWYYHVVGDGRCPVVDTWWQTETGGILITPLPGAITLKPGSATLPFFGIKPEIMDNEGRVREGAAEGILVISRSWPGQAVPFSATISVLSTPILKTTPAIILPATARAAMKTAISGLPGGLTM